MSYELYNTTESRNVVRKHKIIPLRVVVLEDNLNITNTTQIEVRVAGTYAFYGYEMDITGYDTATINNENKTLQFKYNSSNQTTYCFSEIDTATQNLALNSYVEDSNAIDGNYTKDQNNNTEWHGAAGDYIVYHLPDSRLIDKITILGNTLSGESNLTVRPRIFPSRSETVRQARESRISCTLAHQMCKDFL